MISSAPIARQMSAFSSLETTQTGVAPPLRAYCVAKPPSPPLAPQIRTLSPCFMPAPLWQTSWRYAVELTSPGEAASSQVRWAGLGISWLDFTRASSASPPKLVSKPQIRCSGSSIVSLWPSGLSSSTLRQWATTSSPGCHRCTPGPGAQHHAGQVGADDVVGQVVPLGQRAEPPVALEEAERRHRLEDARPDGVVVDGARHHRDQRLARARARGRVRRRRAATCAGPCPCCPGPRRCRPRPCGRSRPGRTRGPRGRRTPRPRCHRRGWRRGSAARGSR